jgi:hypothetical protein
VNCPRQDRAVIAPEPHSVVFEEMVSTAQRIASQELQLVNYFHGLVARLKGVKYPLWREDVKVPSPPIYNNDDA